jgi:hypothetical protein
MLSLAEPRVAAPGLLLDMAAPSGCNRAMIIANEADITRAVLSEVERTADPRLRRALSLAVQHLHAFVREAELTDPEFRNICALIAPGRPAHHRFAQ